MHFLLTFLGILLPGAVHAHGFGHQQVIDLSLPHHLYIMSAAAAVALSFVLIAVFLRSHQPKLWLITTNVPFPVHLVSMVCKWLMVLLILATIFIGYAGPRSPRESIVPNIIWVIWNIGFVYFVMVFGNMWPSIHPAALRFWNGKKRWHPYIGVWPAVVLFLFYRWIENISDHTENPRALATFIIAYLIVTAIGMHRFGTKTWLHNADPFGVFFRLIGLSAPFQKSKNSQCIAIHVPGAGLLKTKAVHFSETCFVMAMLGTIAFDGLKGTELWAGMFSPTPFAQTIGMAAVIIIMLVVYICACVLSELFSGREGRHPLPFLEYAFALLPIAIGYEIAHYIYFFLAESQTFLVLMSDPMGTGSNIFGTALNTVRYDFFSPETLWNIQIMVIVLGHVFSVFIAHIIALHIYGNRFMALRSQLPILLLMIAYTVFSLWTITLPTVITL